MASQIEIITTVDVTPLIRSVRDQRVILDRDLAIIYGVQTFRLNEAVKRNRERFPGDFLFQLTVEERDALSLYRTRRADGFHRSQQHQGRCSPLPRKTQPTLGKKPPR